MRNNTILIISILAMILLAGSLLDFTFTMNVDSNRNGEAYIEIRNSEEELVETIPASGKFDIFASSNVQKVTGDLYAIDVYTATIFANTKNSPIYTDTKTVEFGYYSSPHTFIIDISGKEPDDPPAGD